MWALKSIGNRQTSNFLIKMKTLGSIDAFWYLKTAFLNGVKIISKFLRSKCLKKILKTIGTKTTHRDISLYTKMVINCPFCLIVKKKHFLFCLAWCDCQLYDAHSLSESFEYHKTPVSIIKYVYHAYILKIKIEQLNLDLLRALFEQLTSTFTIRDIWLVLGYHLAGCFWGDQDGCVEYLEYFTQCNPFFFFVLF